MVETACVIQGEPQCMKKLVIATDKGDVTSSLIAQGYNACLYLGVTSDNCPYIGTHEEQWRFMGMWMFFKERFDTSDLPVRVKEDTPVLVGKKLYVHGKSVGRAALFGILTAFDVYELLQISDRTPAMWSDTASEQFAQLQYCWRC